MLIRCPPKIVRCAFDRNKDLIKMPGISRAPLPAADADFKLLSEFQAPLANRLVGDADSSCCKQYLYMAITQAEPETEPDGMGNDLDRESVPRIG